MPTLARIRSWLLAVLAFELIGTLAELLLLRHFENLLQWIPLVLVALALLLIAWHAAQPAAANIVAMRALMALMIAAGMTGVVLHLRGASEFQLELDPSQSRWTVLKKALAAQAPPALAPGVMLQMGLLGLIYAYRHPAGAAGDAASLSMESDQ